MCVNERNETFTFTRARCREDLRKKKLSRGKGIKINTPLFMTEAFSTISCAAALPAAQGIQQLCVFIWYILELYTALILVRVTKGIASTHCCIAAIPGVMHDGPDATAACSGKPG